MTKTTNAKLAVSRRLRSTPYTPRIESLGVSDYSIVNHTVLPKGFGKSVDEDYWHLREDVQMWDVSCQRQVEIKGKDAAKLVQLMTPRDLRNAQTGQCFYAPVIDDKAGMLNDPIILVLASDHYWLSIADSDLLLWAKGLAVGFSLEVEIDEPDVSPLAVQGPRSDDLVSRVFGDVVRSIGFFRFLKLDFQGHPLVVARSGYSKQGGFEIYLDDSSLGLSLWDALWDAGHDLNVRPGSPNLIERIEGGLMSYGNEFTRENNPLECGLEPYCKLDGSIDYIGREALLNIKRKGSENIIRGICFSGERCPPCASTWPLLADNADQSDAGFITSAIWSPRFGCNIAMAMMKTEYSSEGQEIKVHLGNSVIASGFVTALPFDGCSRVIKYGKSTWPEH